MATKNYNFQMDLKEKIPTIPITLVQGDENSNVFNISLIEDELPVDLTESTVTITMKKPDNTVIVGSCSVVNALTGLIKYVCGTNDIAALGTVIFTVEIFMSNMRVSSTQGKFKVISELDNGLAIPSTTEYGILTTLITDFNTATYSEAEQKTYEQIRKDNEIIRQANEVTRQNNEGDNTKGRIKAENDRVIAENIRVSNENIRLDNEGDNTKGRIKAENDRVIAENIRKDNEVIRQSNESDRIATYTTFTNYTNGLATVGRIAYELDGGWLGVNDGSGLNIEGGWL